MKTHLFRTTLIAIAVLLTIGCESETNEAHSLQDGLTVLSASETSLSIAFKSGEQMIYLEALRGQATPEMYQQDPEMPKYEVDARFAAANGRLFYTARGGDRWIEPKWVDDLNAQESRYPNRESNYHLHLLAFEAAKVLDAEVTAQVGPELAAKMAPMLKPLRDFGMRAPEVYAEQLGQLNRHLVEIGFLPEDNPVTGSGEVTFGSGGTDCDAWVTFDSSYYYIALHDKSTALIARHSATRLYQWVGYWSHVHDNCNHGTCAGDMSKKCNLSYTEAVEDYKPSWEIQSCGTSYHMYSNTGHNCHDDSRVQMANFVYGNGHNQGPGSNFWCYGDEASDISDGIGDQGGSPECNNSQTEGYRHPDMCRVQNLTGWNSAGGCSCAASCVNYNNCCIDGPVPVPQCTPASNKLCPGESLSVGQYRTSSDGQYRLLFQGDGNLVLYRLRDYAALWAAGWNSYGGAAASMQEDGNFVTYNSYWSSTWSSGTWGNIGAYMVVQSGYIAVYNANGVRLWGTGY